jgi:hypothetical protein
VFRNMVIFYGEELELDHPLSAVRDCIFAGTLHIRRPFLHPQPEDAPCRGDRDPLIMGISRHNQGIYLGNVVWGVGASLFVPKILPDTPCQQNAEFENSEAVGALSNHCVLKV